MSTAESCKKKFKLSYIDKVKIEKSSNFALEKGGLLHEMIENDFLHNIKIDISSKLTQIGQLKTLNSIFDILVSNKSYILLKDKYKLSKEKYVELGIGFDDNWNPVEYNKGTKFRGYIDLVIFNEDSAIIVDWKSGKFKEHQDFSQVSLYSLWVMKMYPNIKK